MTSYHSRARIIRNAPLVQSGGTIDDFEDGDWAEYALDKGSSSYVSVQGTTVYEGSNALEIAISGGENTDIFSLPGDGLPYYPQAGDTFTVRHQSDTTGSNQQVKFGYGLAVGLTGTGDGYVVDHRYGDGALEFYRFDGGSGTKLSGATCSFAASEWNATEIQWGTDGTHTVTAYDSAGTQLAQVVATDSTYANRGVGYSVQSTGTTTGWYDAAATGSPDFGSTDDGSTGGGSTTFNPEQLVDDFEDGDWAEYAVDRGSASSITVQGTTVYEGSNALEIAIPGGENTDIFSVPGDGLPYYPQAGDTFTVRHRSDTTGGNQQVKFGYGLATGVTLTGDGYVVDHRYGDGQFRLRRYDGGSGTELASTSCAFGASEWNHSEIQWGTDGSHTVTAYDSAGTQLAQVVATDSTYTNRGVGYSVQSTGTTTGWFDAVGVVNLGST